MKARTVNFFSNAPTRKKPWTTCEEHLFLFRTFNTLVGLPVFVLADSMTGLLPKLFYAYQHFTEAVVAVGVFGQFWAVPHIMDDMNVLCACMSSGTHSMQVVFKTSLALLYMKPKVLQNIKAMNGILADRMELESKVRAISDAPNFQDYCLEQTKFVRRSVSVFFIMMVTSTTFYFIPILVDSIVRSDDLEGQLTPIVFYFHFDFMYTPGFQIVNTFLTTCFYLVNTKTVVFDGFFLGLITFHTIQFRYLKVLLDAIVEKMESRKGHEVNDKELLKLWITQHQAQMRVTAEFAKVMSLYLLFEFAYVFIHTCVPAFVITSTSSWTPSQKFGVFFIIGVGLVQLLLMSRAGDFLTEAIDNAPKSLYQFRIFKKTGKWQRVVFNMTSARLMREVQLKGSVFPLCCPTFLTIARLILSYYVTLNEVQRMKINK